MSILHPVSVFVAARRLRGTVRRTELRHSSALSAAAGAAVHLKLESDQLTGSFKIRGAYNVIASLPEPVRRRGVVAASAGNHGVGVAHAAREFGIQATIFVPATAPRVKLSGMTQLDAHVDTSAEHFDAARRLAEAMAEREGATFIHPCEGEVLIAGQGTVGLELLEDLPELTTIIVPVGGAGLVAGIASIVRAVAPQVRIIGVQTEHTDTIARALAAGRPVASDHRPTIAEGLAGDADAYALDLARVAVDEMVVVSEEETARAIAWLHEHEGVTAEGSAAVGVAAVLGGHVPALAAPAVVVITGRNIDRDRHEQIMERFARR